MEGIMGFFSSHMVLFCFLGVMSLCALVGYFVDQSERKKGISKITPTFNERDIRELATKAEQKSLNTAITDAAKKSNSLNTTTITEAINKQANVTPPGNTANK